MADQQFVAVGDVHGCVRSLEALLKQLEPYEDRKIVFVGDYIDRGPDSKAVVDFLLEYRKDHDCVFIRGNHEQMLLDAVRQGDMSLWMMNGGGTTLNSYGDDRKKPDLPEHHLQFYKETLIYYDTPDYFFVHAGAPPNRTIAESMEDPNSTHHFIWERSHLNALETAWEKKVVFGHTPRPNPLKKGKMIGIDTGCVYQALGYGKLTAALLPEEEFVTQFCLD